MNHSIEHKIRRDDVTGCWVWCGSTTKTGYGFLTVRVDGQKRGVFAHRVSYESSVGPIPAGLEIDHLCRNRSCVNPEHLEPVTHAENVRRAWLAATKSDLCKRGHPLDRINTCTGRRRCKTCNTENRRRNRALRAPDAETMRRTTPVQRPEAS